MYQILYYNQAGDQIADLSFPGEEKEKAHDTYDHAITGTVPVGVVLVVFIDGGRVTKRGSVTVFPPDPEPEDVPAVEMEPEPVKIPAKTKSVTKKKA